MALNRNGNQKDIDPLIAISILTKKEVARSNGINRASSPLKKLLNSYSAGKILCVVFLITIVIA